MFRPYSLTSLGAWTVGSLAGNHAHYSTKEKQTLQSIAGDLTEEYLKYGEYGGKLSITDWLQEKFYRNSQLTPQEVAVRAIILEFQGRNLPLIELTWFEMTHLNIVLNENSMQYRALKKRPFDWLDNETLYPLCEAFFHQFIEEGLSQEDAMIAAMTFLGGRIGQKRSEEFCQYLQQKIRERDDSKSESPTVSETRPQTDQHNFTKDLYISRGSETLGPYTYSQLLRHLKTGLVKLDDLVAYDDAPAWLKVKKLIVQVQTGQI
jgi:hypothetical protein